MLGEWRIAGQAIRPEAIKVPSYILVPGKDRLVAPGSARPLAQALPHATLHQPMTGHIGIMASANAPRQVWRPLFEWLASHS
jgi:polyhydroxyalkanoate synthase